MSAKKAPTRKPAKKAPARKPAKKAPARKPVREGEDGHGGGRGKK